eukprot:gene18952-21560_t
MKTNLKSSEFQTDTFALQTLAQQDQLLRLEPALVRSTQKASSASALSPRGATRMQEGDKVEGNYRGKGKWYTGRISRVNADGTYNVDYDDGEQETRLEGTLVRPLGGVSTGGGIGRSPVRPAPELVRVVGGAVVRTARSRSPERITEGAKVEGNYRGKGKWYTGRISRVNADGTYNVDYDDGEKETRLEASLVRLIGGAAATPGRGRSPSPASLVRALPGSAAPAFGGRSHSPVRDAPLTVGSSAVSRSSPVNADGSFNIDYDDGQHEIYVEPSHVRAVASRSLARSLSPPRLG